MAGRPIVALISLILLAGGCLLSFFIILSGAIKSDPINKVWFLSAVTKGIGNAPDITAWTYFAVCPVGAGTGGTTFNCRPVKAAQPFDPVSNFATTKNVPAAFLNTHHYYYLSRFSWAFYIIALFFGVIALFTGIIALCSRIGSYLSSVSTFLGAFFMGLASALMTAWTVQARSAFNRTGHTATLGRYAYGFSWGAFAAFFIASILFCVAGSTGGSKDKTYTGEKRGRFGRSRNTRASGGVKDEYS